MKPHKWTKILTVSWERNDRCLTTCLAVLKGHSLYDVFSEM